VRFSGKGNTIKTIKHDSSTPQNTVFFNSKSLIIFLYKIVTKTVDMNNSCTPTDREFEMLLVN